MHFSTNPLALDVVFDLAADFAARSGYCVAAASFEFVDAETRTACPLGAACCIILGRAPASVAEAAAALGWPEARVLGFIDAFHQTFEFAEACGEGEDRNSYDAGHGDGCKARRHFADAPAFAVDAAA